MKNDLTTAQRWADAVTVFSGSWPFIIWSTAIGVVWIVLNVSGLIVFDPYPFLFLNWVLTVVSTLQSPLIMLSQNRQNERDSDNLKLVLTKLEEIQKQQ